MAKFVKFLGADVNFYDSDDPCNLVRGQIYEIEDEKVIRGKVYYKLKGIKGYWNSYWFWVIEIAS